MNNLFNYFIYRFRLARCQSCIFISRSQSDANLSCSQTRYVIFEIIGLQSNQKIGPLYILSFKLNFGNVYILSYRLYQVQLRMKRTVGKMQTIRPTILQPQLQKRRKILSMMIQPMCQPPNLVPKRSQWPWRPQQRRKNMSMSYSSDTWVRE